MMDDKERKKALEKALKGKDMKALIKLINEVIEYDKEIEKKIASLKELIKKDRLKGTEKKLRYVA